MAKDVSYQEWTLKDLEKKLICNIYATVICIMLADLLAVIHEQRARTVKCDKLNV